MRSLGEFFGHIVQGARKPISPAGVVSREVEEETRAVPGGSVVLRRTTIEEVEMRPGEPQRR